MPFLATTKISGAKDNIVVCPGSNLLIFLKYEFANVFSTSDIFPSFTLLIRPCLYSWLIFLTGEIKTNLFNKSVNDSLLVISEPIVELIAFSNLPNLLFCEVDKLLLATISLEYIIFLTVLTWLADNLGLVE